MVHKLKRWIKKWPFNAKLQFLTERFMIGINVSYNSYSVQTIWQKNSLKGEVKDSICAFIPFMR